MVNSNLRTLPPLTWISRPRAQQHVDATIWENVRVLVGYGKGGVVLQPGQHGGQAVPIQVVGFLELECDVTVGGRAVHEDGMASGVRLEGKANSS